MKPGKKNGMPDLGWLSAWWCHYKENRELWLITAWTRDELVGAAPLMKTNEWKHGLQFRLLHSLGSPNCDESDFPVQNGNRQILRALCDYLYPRRSQWDAITLNEFESQNKNYRQIDSRPKNGRFKFVISFSLQLL